MEESFKTLSVLLVEDDRATRDTLHSLIELDFSHVYSASDGCQGLDLFLKYRPDIVISDIEMPCMNGLELLERIRRESPNTLILFVTAKSDSQHLLKAIDFNINAYLVKPIQYKDILEKVLQFFSLPKESEVSELLSKREYEVFLDIVKGIKPKDIAIKYNLKAKTIGTYRTRILEKLQLTTNTELIRYAMKCKVI